METTNKQTKYYSCYQDGILLATGMNSETEEECVRDVFELHMTDYDDEDDPFDYNHWPTSDMKSHLESQGYFFEEHEKPLGDFMIMYDDEGEIIIDL